MEAYNDSNILNCLLFALLQLEGVCMLQIHMHDMAGLVVSGILLFNTTVRDTEYSLGHGDVL